MSGIEIRPVVEHYEVYQNGRFLFSGDTLREVEQDLEEMEETKMKMNEAKSRTWTKVAEIKTDAETLKDIYKAICKEFDSDFYEDVLDVADAIREGYIQICEDGFIIWCS